MSEDNDQNKLVEFDIKNSDPEAFKKQPAKSEVIVHKLALIKKVREISKGDWLLTQDILQDIEAQYIAENETNKKPTSQKSIDLLKEEIEKRYAEDEELKTLLIDSIPSAVAIRKWRLLDGWDEAVWIKAKNGAIFNQSNRHKVMMAMHRKACDGDVAAAKVWLTMSGDYSDKMDINTDKRLDTYREINEILHKKKVEE
jgi:hypothetical protein